MKPGLGVGSSSSVEFVVDEKMAAASEGKQIHAVLSTFHLVYYAELAARRLIEPYLEDREEAAGSEIAIRHLAPTGIGDTVKITATLTSFDGKKMICSVEGTNSAGRICTGSQTQVLVKKGSLL